MIEYRGPDYIPHADISGLDEWSKNRLTNLSEYLETAHAILPGNVLLNHTLLKHERLYTPSSKSKIPNTIANTSKVYEFSTRRQVAVLYLGLVVVEPVLVSKNYITSIESRKNIFMRFLYGDVVFYFCPAIKASAVETFLCRKIEIAMVNRNDATIQFWQDILARHRAKYEPYRGHHVGCGYLENIEVDQIILDTVLHNNFRRLDEKRTTI